MMPSRTSPRKSATGAPGTARPPSSGGSLFVVLAVGLMGSGTLKKQTLSSVDQIAGKAGEAERILDEAGLRPTEEIVLIQSENATVGDPAFKARDRRIRAVARRPPKHVKQHRLAARRRGRRDLRRRPLGLRRVPDRRQGKRGGRKPRAEQRRRSSASSASTPSTPSASSAAAAPTRRSKRRFTADVGKAGMLSLPITLLILLRRSRRHGRRQRPVRPRPHLGDGDDGDGRDPQPAVRARRQHRGADPADRPRGRGRLLAVLHATRSARSGRPAQTIATRSKWQAPPRDAP